MTPDSSSQSPGILLRLAAGEACAMNECIDHFGGMVWSVVKRSVPHATDAEDLVQQIFTEVWQKAVAFDPATASETTFVALIARRRTIDHLRKTGRLPELEPIEAAATLPAAEAESPPLNCDAEAVRAALAHLADDTRYLFQLFFEQGYTHPEISARTGLALGTVKTRLRRGLIAIREHLRANESTIFHSNP